MAFNKKDINDETEKETTNYCECSIYSHINPKGKVHELQCVRDGLLTTPCFVVLLSQKKIDDDDTHKWELRIRGFLWRLRHPLWRWKHRKCPITHCLFDKRRKQLRSLVNHFVNNLISPEEAVGLMEDLIKLYKIAIEKSTE